MLTLLLIVLIVLLVLNGSGRLPGSANTLWTILIVLLVVWMLFAFGVIGDYGYWPRRSLP